jgi:uncharacterized protein DUF6378/uncharacterized protein DUF4406
MALKYKDLVECTNISTVPQTSIRELLGMFRQYDDQKKSRGKKRMKIYCAGAISNIEVKSCRKQFMDAERRLVKNGHTVINPVRLDMERGALPSWKAYMQRDIPLLIKCDGIRLLEGWESSNGAKLEAHIADALGIRRVDSDGYYITEAMASGVAYKLQESILVEADKLVNGPRQASYGRPLGDFKRTGRLWGALLKLDRDVTPIEVGLCMAALKLSREVNKHKRDNLVDASGYSATVQMIAEDLGLAD